MKIKYYIYSLIAAVMLIFTACTPDNYSMSSSSLTSSDLQEGIAFTVTKDVSNPNLVHLKSLMKGYSSVWSHPGVGLGHSQGDSTDLKIAFAGTYPVVFGVDTKAGVVYSDTVKVVETTFCADFVNDDNWTYLTGGSGKSKTWIPDNGNYGMKQGFYSCFAPTATHSDMTHDTGKNNWYPYVNGSSLAWWEPSNSDIGNTSADLAQYITFSLQGSAGITVKDYNGNIKSGTFTFDDSSWTLNADGVEFPHGAWATGKSLSFSKNFYVFHLDNNQLMIANLRDKGLSGEGPCWYVWNFVSKDYASSYTPTTVTEPSLPSGWETAITQQTNTTITWQLSADSPFDWFTLAGTRKNSYAAASDYPSFITPVSGIDNIQLVMNSSTNSYELDKDNSPITSGTYTLSDKGVYKFSNGLGKTLLGGDWVYLGADFDNDLRIMTYDVKSSTGKVDNLWLGAKQTDNEGNLYQYLGYHFIAKTYGDVASYASTLNYFSTGWSYTKASDALNITKAGTYDITVNGSNNSAYGLYMDVKNLLKDHPKATLTLNKVTVDGKDLTGIDYTYSGFTKNSDGTQLVADSKSDPYTARIYVLNPWDSSNPFSSEASLLDFTSSITVNFTVAFND